MSWEKGRGFFRNLKALNESENEKARLRQEQKEAERLQRGYDRVSGGDVGYHQTLSGASGGTKYGDLVAPGDSGLQYGGNYAGAERLSTGNIDFNDKDQVMKIQEALGVEVDGIFGPQTEAAYRQAINQRRGALGAEEYDYTGGTGNTTTSGQANPLVTEASNDNVIDETDIPTPVEGEQGSGIDPYSVAAYANPFGFVTGPAYSLYKHLKK